MHFYTETQNGIEPKHFVPMTSRPDELRPSRVTDAKKAAKQGEIWFPSVTTVMDILDKGGLNNWRIDQHLETAWSIQEISGVIAAKDFEEFKKLIKHETEMRLEQAPKAGTDTHKLLEENLFTGEIPEGVSEIEHKIIRNVEQVILDNCGKQNWEKEKYFIDSELGYAGCADLVSKGWVIDFKTKQDAAKWKPQKMAFADHSRQLAAYGFAMTDGIFNAANIFICLEDASVDFHLHTPDQIDKGFGDFGDCLSIFKRNKYNPLEV